MARKGHQLMKAISGGAVTLFVLAMNSVSAPVFPAAFDGSAPLLCASVTVMDCDPKGEWSRRGPDDVNLPVLSGSMFQGRPLPPSTGAVRPR